MPYAKPSWRQWPQFRWLSRTLCFFGNHNWMHSKTLGKPIVCCVCSKRSRHYTEYKKIFTKDP